jgi:hypothetical protein
LQSNHLLKIGNFSAGGGDVYDRTLTVPYRTAFSNRGGSRPVFDRDQRAAVFPQVSASALGKNPMSDIGTVLAVFIGLAAVTTLWFFGLVVAGGFGLP